MVWVEGGVAGLVLVAVVLVFLWCRLMMDVSQQMQQYESEP